MKDQPFFAGHIFNDTLDIPERPSINDAKKNGETLSFKTGAGIVLGSLIGLVFLVVATIKVYFSIQL